MGYAEMFEVSDHSLMTTAAVFKQVAGDINGVIEGAAGELRVEPWLGKDEPVSDWAARQFNQHFTQFLERLTELGKQHQQLSDTLTQARLNYLAVDGHDAG
jgi:hypothetical protein